MINHTVDSWEVRQLVERYASGADRGDGEGVASLFTEDGEFVLWLDPDSPDPTSHRRGRAEIAQSIDPDNANLQKGACDRVLNEDVDALGDDFFRGYTDVDCWVLDQALERIRHPERLLQRIRKVIAPGSSIVAVIPNGQHWSVLARLCIGDLRYADSGILATSNRRMFSRGTLFELFQQNGFAVEQGLQMQLAPLQNDNVVAAIRQLAVSVGADPDLAVTDAQPTAYIIRAVPK